jgi:hypothetical protein
MWGISRVAENLLASQEGLCSMELVISLCTLIMKWMGPVFPFFVIYRYIFYWPSLVCWEATQRAVAAVLTRLICQQNYRNYWQKAVLVVVLGEFRKHRFIFIHCANVTIFLEYHSNCICNSHPPSQKFPLLYTLRRFSTVLTAIHHWIFSWAR